MSHITYTTKVKITREQGTPSITFEGEDAEDLIAAMYSPSRPESPGITSRFYRRLVDTLGPDVISDMLIAGSRRSGRPIPFLPSLTKRQELGQDH